MSSLEDSINIFLNMDNPNPQIVQLKKPEGILLPHFYYRSDDHIYTFGFGSILPSYQGKLKNIDPKHKESFEPARYTKHNTATNVAQILKNHGEKRIKKYEDAQNLALLYSLRQIQQT